MSLVASARRIALLLALLAPSLASADEPIVGHWLENWPEAKIKIDDRAQGRFGGWQTSDMTYDSHSKTWWSVGDQNCREDAEFLSKEQTHRGRYLYRIRSLGNHPQAEAVPIWWKTKTPEFDQVRDSFKPDNPKESDHIDFEGLAADPNKPNHFFACTEGTKPWLVEIEFNEAEKKANVIRTVRISTQGNHDRNKANMEMVADKNSRWEGIAVSSDGQTIYLATEWVDSPVRIYSISVADFRKGEWAKDASGNWTPPRVFPNPLKLTGFDGQLSGLCFISRDKKDYLVALERNGAGKQIKLPMLYLFDIAQAGAPVKQISLDLRAPSTNKSNSTGVKLVGASPEGIGTDGHETLVLISDPVRDFYTTSATDIDHSKLDNLVPLVFEMKLSKLFQ